MSRPFRTCAVGPARVLALSATSFVIGVLVTPAKFAQGSPQAAPMSQPAPPVREATKAPASGGANVPGKAASASTGEKASALSNKEQTDLTEALADSGNSMVDLTRALEKHLEKYPNSPRRPDIERALAKAAIESKDDPRIIKYGEVVLATNPGDLQLLDRVAHALVATDDPERSKRALKYCERYESGLLSMRQQAAPGHVNEAQWQADLDRGLARVYAIHARALGNTGKPKEAVKFARQSYDAFPSAEGAREIARWLNKTGQSREAVSHLADAFIIEDPRNTEIDRRIDRKQLGEIYQKLNGSEKGLGDVILEAYDRTSAIMADRVVRIQAKDPNSKAGSILDFTLPSLDGQSLQLANLKGKTVILDFWATWCGPCKAQRPLYRVVQDKFHQDPNVVFLSVNTDDDRSGVPDFVKQNHWDEKIYFEAGLQNLLQVNSIPTTIIVDRQGQIASRMNGFVPDRFVDTLTDRIEQTRKN